MPDPTARIEQTLSVDGAELSFDRAGAGPVAIFAHGLTASRANNPGELLDFTPVVTAGFTLVRYDARGHGRSTGSTDPADYHWSALAGDLLALADAVSPGAPVAAIGNSMGTGTILYAALQAPERFSALVLTAPPTAWQSRAAQREAYLSMAGLLEAGETEKLAALMSRLSQPEIFAESTEVPDPDIAPDLLPVVLRGAAGTDLPAPDDLSRISQPTLVLPWATDPGHPVSTAEQLVASMPNAQLRIGETAADVAAFGRWTADFLVGLSDPHP